ncbi:MAG TPA: cache domain-containing protein [Candidatus Omnitrophota bacterium]|nr:cache domain-containing protein [Candidatus Omnitrophota bacterium]
MNRPSIILTSAAIFFAIAFPAFSADKIEYQYQDTKDLVGTVQDAAVLLSQKGLSAINDFKEYGTKWYHGDAYIFVLDINGNMLYHPDPALNGSNEADLTDVDGRPIVRLMIKRALDHSKDNQGWVHYKWPQPGKLFPIWKSTFVKLAVGPRGNKFVVGSGLYRMKMEKRFIVDAVDDAATKISTAGLKAFDELGDRNHNFFLGNTYIFVDDYKGVELLNPAFPELVGKDLSNLKDANGEYMVRDYVALASKEGSGWIDYYWPRPEESIPSKKSTYVKRADFMNAWVVVGCGYYFGERKGTAGAQMNSGQLASFVGDAASLIAHKGEAAFADLRQADSKWYNSDNYIFVWDMNGVRVVYPPDASMEGQNVLDLKDSQGRPIGRSFYAAAGNASNEGWVYYLWPRPGDVYDSWKATFLKRVTAPSHKEYLVGSGVYDMKLDREMIVERVNKAAALIEREGRQAFDKLRDRSGDFVFMDNYVFVETLSGVEVVNPGFPNLEGKNLIDYQDDSGRKIVKEYLDLADRDGAGWTEYNWPKPGRSVPSRKQTYVKKVTVNGETFVVGCGAYLE